MGELDDAVVPLPLDAELDAVTERRLAGLVVTAQRGDAAARNRLHALLQVKLARLAEREWWMIRTRTALIEPGDLVGETFLVLAGLIDEWPGEGGFGAWLMRVFPWRLRAALREQAGLPVRARQHGGLGGWEGVVVEQPNASGGDDVDLTAAGLRAEESWLAGEAITLLETLAGELDDPDRLLLVWRVRDGLSMTLIARRLGMGRRQAQRHWVRITEWIRAEWAA